MVADWQKIGIGLPYIEILDGGIFGLVVAYSCACRGARVRVGENRSIGAG